MTRPKVFYALQSVRNLPSDPLRYPDIQNLTIRFRELHFQMFRDMVETAVELGEIIIKVKKRIKGHFYVWLETVKVSPQAAKNYERLALAVESTPHLITRYKELGLTKLYRLASISDEGRKKILKPEKLRYLAELNDRRFFDLTAPYVKKKKKVSSDQKANGLVQKFKAWIIYVDNAVVRNIKSNKLKVTLRNKAIELSNKLKKLSTEIRI